MDSNVLHVSANSASKYQCKGQDVLDGQASAETERGAEGDGQVEESEDGGYAKDLKDRVEEDGCTGSIRECDRDERAKEGNSMVEDGIVRFVIEGKWRQVPHEHWTWIPVARHRTYQQCQWFVCDSPFDCSERYHAKVFRGHDYVDWIPKLIRIPAHIKDSPKPMTRQSLRSHSDVTLLAAQVPPELFPIVLGWVDDRKLARKCRLVCRSWEEQCRERAFKWINLRGSEKRVLDLVRLKYKPAWRHIPSLVEELDGLPEYTQSIQPWLHLLDPRWRPGIVTIVGPFPGRRTIRSIHFSLPRSLPSSFSRGITSLKLDRVKFRRFEDTVGVISGLPDLVALKLEGVSWESLPTALSRRRPPVNHNKLRYSDFYACTAGEEPESPLFIFTSFILFPHVYSGSSLFSVDVVIALEDVLRASVDSKSGSVITVHTSKRVAGGFVDQINFGEDPQMPLLEIFAPEMDLFGNEIIAVLMYFGDWAITDTEFCSSYKWAVLDTTLNSLQQHIQFLFGFDDRMRMLSFADAVVDKKLPSLSTRGGGVRYAITRKEEEKRAPEDDWPYRYWYQASPESDELRGNGTQHWWKLYP